MQAVLKSAGFPRENEEHDVVPDASRRPLSLAWITEDLLAETRQVWSPRYGRVLSADEAIEILCNVKRLAELLVKGKANNSKGEA